MAFWIFMLIMDLVIPLIMLGFGSYFVKTPPKEINSLFGYRTTMSTKNKETWAFAHHYCGKIWRSTGFFMLIVSVVAMLFVVTSDLAAIGKFGGILCFAQGAVMIVSIFPTEKALTKHFDKNGNRKNDLK